MPTLVLSEIFPPRTGGSGRWFWEIYRRLDRREYHFAVGEAPGHAEFDRTHTLRLHRLPLAMSQWGLLSWVGARAYLKHVRRLATLVHSQHISRIHCGRCLPEGVMCLALKMWTHTPYICFVHGEDVNTALHSREHTLLVRQVLAGADYCIANSHNTARLLRTQWRCAEQRLHVLHPGVDTQQFRPAGRSPSVRRHLAWDNRPVILTAGRLQRRKGHDMLIRALPDIRAHLPRILYAIIGEGPERNFLQDLAQQLGVQDAVQFLGEISDPELCACYQQCDLFALPNREIAGDIEGFGMVLLEAQACGRPVLAGTSGGTAETMRCGETGEVVDCCQPQPLAEAVIRFLSDPQRCSRMGQAARRWTVEHFDWDSLALQAQAIFFSDGRASRRGASLPAAAFAVNK
ncbi:MAG: glycosyltransferase family 4 protein [Planctomycetales bacterium]|nr:glycosyltransferase family 4 protein [Planctomycetales bacterium]